MEFDYKEYAKQMRENAVKNENGIVFCSSELWEEIASIIEKSEEVKHGEWISVEERLPEHKDWVLVWHTGYETPKKAKYKDAAIPMFILDGYDRNDGEVTHWMPLPEGPGER